MTGLAAELKDSAIRRCGDMILEHLEILGCITDAFKDEIDVENVVKSADNEAIYKILMCETP